MDRSVGVNLLNRSAGCWSSKQIWEICSKCKSIRTLLQVFFFTTENYCTFASFLWEWQRTGTGCPESCGVSSSGDNHDPSGSFPVWPTVGNYFSKGVGLGDLQRFLPTPSILWFCEGRTQSKKEQHTVKHTVEFDFTSFVLWQEPRPRTYIQLSRWSNTVLIYLQIHSQETQQFISFGPLKRCFTATEGVLLHSNAFNKAD